MKKIILFLVFFLLLQVASGAEKSVLKLRTSSNAGYTRIVLEGPEPVITRAIVNQAEQNILVTFLGADISVQAETPMVSFRTMDNNKVLFSPGKFSGMKVLTLRDPVRLVIDVYSGVPFAFGGNVESSPSDRKDTGWFSGHEDEAAVGTGTVMIDPGHGGFESGMGKEGHVEKNTVLDIARKLGVLVDKGSFKSALTRSGDLFMSMDERVKSANSSKPDIFISLHIGNHREVVIYMPVITESVQGDIKEYLYNKGQETYLKKTVALLNAVKDAVTEDFGNDMVTVRPLPYSVLSRIEAAALMIELPSFEYRDYTEGFKLKIANTINKGLNLYGKNESQ